MNNIESHVENIASTIEVIAGEMEVLAKRSPSLRELAAIAAMQGLLARAREIDEQTIARISVRCADALLKELQAAKASK